MNVRKLMLLFGVFVCLFARPVLADEQQYTEQIDTVNDPCPHVGHYSPTTVSPLDAQAKYQKQVYRDDRDGSRIAVIGRTADFRNAGYVSRQLHQRGIRGTPAQYRQVTVWSKGNEKRIRSLARRLRGVELGLSDLLTKQKSGFNTLDNRISAVKNTLSQKMDALSAKDNNRFRKLTDNQTRFLTLLDRYKSDIKKDLDNLKGLPTIVGALVLFSLLSLLLHAWHTAEIRRHGRILRKG